MKIAHIVNPVNVSPESDLYIAQPITFETMRRAKKVASDNGVDVELLYACYEEDTAIAPDGFIFAGYLNRSIMDVGDFSQQRKLPLIKDILDRMYEKSDAEYFIYTNVDISLYERFYVEVERIISSGYDAFVINRRTLPSKYTSVDELDYMYSDKGGSHPGFDCFVFRRHAYPKYELGEACIGANWIGRVLLSNLIVHSDKFRVFEDEYLTFHIGDDRSWKVAKYNDYDLHNQKIALSILRSIDEAGELSKSELLVEFKEQFEEEDKIRLICEANIFYKHIDIRNNGINQSPIFIVGFPRSGTTLLQSLVATQNIYTFQETHYFNLVLNSINTSGEIVKDAYDGIINAIEERYPLSVEAKDYIWYCLKRKGLSVKKLFEIQVIDGLIKQGVDEEDLSSVRWVEKTPSHAFKLQQIKQYYPQAKFIYILRNPLDAFSSWRRVSAGWGQPALPVEEYASLWIKLLKSAERFDKKYPGDLKFIRLEELIDNVNLIVEELMLFINNEFIAAALDNRGKESDHFILPNEKWKISGAVGAITKDASDNAADKLTLTEKIKSEYMLNKYMKKYGYEIKYWHGEKLERSNYYQAAYDWINTFLSELINRCYMILKRMFGRVLRLYTHFKK